MLDYSGCTSGGVFGINIPVRGYHRHFTTLHAPVLPPTHNRHEFAVDFAKMLQALRAALSLR